jgi:hypothetical protein
MSDNERDSAEYRAAHLAFSRATIVEKAAHGERIYDLLLAYTEDVIKAERDANEATQRLLDALGGQ